MAPFKITNRHIGPILVLIVLVLTIGFYASTPPFIIDNIFKELWHSIGIPVSLSATTAHGPDYPTRSGMASLKTALQCYVSDIGRFPHTGPLLSSTTILLADKHCLNSHFSRNVLVNQEVGHPFEWNGMASASYAKRWKGPYLDSAPEEFMLDGWGKKIRFGLHWETTIDAASVPTTRASIFLQSAGGDGVFDNLALAAVATYTGDDIVLRVAKTKIRPD